jgi:hypothetical protein
MKITLLYHTRQANNRQSFSELPELPRERPCLRDNSVCHFECLAGSRRRARAVALAYGSRLNGELPTIP